MVYAVILKTPVKMDDLGGPIIFGNTHLVPENAKIQAMIAVVGFAPLLRLHHLHTKVPTDQAASTNHMTYFFKFSLTSGPKCVFQASRILGK